MKLQIAAIFSPPAVGYMKEILPELNPYCDVALLEASSMREARALFDANAQQYDAVVFSGRIYMVYATRNSYSAAVPCFSFDEMVYDLMPALYRLMLNDRQFDFSRVSVDFLDARDTVGVKKLFPENQLPFGLDEGFTPFLAVDDVNGELLTKKVLDWHLALYRAEKTALAITCHGAITPELEAAGVPYLYIAPSRETIINFFMQIINSLSLRFAQDQLLGVVILRCGTQGEKDGLIARCSEAITAFARLNACDFTFARDVGRMELIMRYKELSFVTQGFQAMPFGELLGNEVNCGLRVGVGTGNTLFQARNNAANALSTSGVTGKTYYVSYDGKLTGPLGQAHSEYELQPDAGLIGLSQDCGVDPLSLQQMRAFTKMAGKSVVTAQELAPFMGISRRTASRLLTKLANGGGAEIYAQNAPGGKGRPRNSYRLLFTPTS